MTIVSMIIARSIHCFVAILLTSVSTLVASELLDSEQDQSRSSLKIIESRLSKTNINAGIFSQSKKLHNFPFPIESSGDFSINNKGELNWNLRQPIQSRLIISEKGITVSGKNSLNDAQSRPEIDQITQVVRAVLSMNWDLLEQHFSIQVRKPAPNWQLSLAPKSAILSASISNIELYGRDSLEKVIIEEVSKDTTTIQFDTAQSTP